MKTTKRVDWSPKKRATAITLRNEGYSFREIAGKIGCGVTASGIRKLCKRFETTKSIETKLGRGRKRKTTPKTDRQIARLALKNRKASSGDINGILHEAGVSVSNRTVRRRLVDVGLRARIPRKKPFLNVKQRQKRLNWAKEHLSWSLEDWGRVIWSDETKISIFGSDGVRYVRRRSGEDYIPECLTSTMKHPLSVMVWGCMSRRKVGRLQVLEGNITATRYVSEVLKPKMLPSVSDMFGSDEPYIFQQDGAPCHTAHLCQKWFTSNSVQVLDWPGNSPDLNPIENLWSRLKRAVGAKRPGNKRELIESIIGAWYHIITPEHLEALVDSMPRRCQAVIDARGYPTRY